MPDNQQIKEAGEDRLNSRWKGVYLLVIILTIAVITSLGLFSRYFSG